MRAKTVMPRAGAMNSNLKLKRHVNARAHVLDAERVDPSYPLA